MARTSPTPEQVRALRASAGLTQRRVADILDCSARAVRAWELGERNMPSSLYRLLSMHISESKRQP